MTDREDRVGVERAARRAERERRLAELNTDFDREVAEVRDRQRAEVRALQQAHDVERRSLLDWYAAERRAVVEEARVAGGATGESTDGGETDG